MSQDLTQEFQFVVSRANNSSVDEAHTEQQIQQCDEVYINGPIYIPYYCSPIYVAQPPPFKRQRISDTDCNTFVTDMTVIATVFPSVAMSVCQKESIPLNKKQSSAARLYYKTLFSDNNNKSSFEHKKLKIYNDLVIGTKSKLEMNEEIVTKQEIELNYKLQNKDIIETCKCYNLICVGRSTECDILLESPFVSRVNCFIFAIQDSLIIFDAWSANGVRVISVNGISENMEHSLPKERRILRFHKEDHVILKFAESQIVLNPKECVICMENARSVKAKCGHFTLCNKCYDSVIKSDKPDCPICGETLIRVGLYDNNCHETYVPDQPAINV